MATTKDDSLLLEVSDLANGLSQMVKLCKPLVAPKGTTIDAPKLRAAGLKLRKLIAGSLDLASPPDASDKVQDRADWAQAAMEELMALDSALASGLRALRFDPTREAPKLIKALKAANNAAGRPSWAKPKVTALSKALPSGGPGEEKLFHGVDARHVAAFPLLIVVWHLHKWMKAELNRLPNL